jgi:hypothetical protein
VPRSLGNFVAMVRNRFPEAPPQYVAKRMEVTVPTFKVQELAKWAPSAKVLKRTTNTMDLLDKSSISDEAKSEERAILEKISVWKSLSLEDICANMA